MRQSAKARVIRIHQLDRQLARHNAELRLCKKNTILFLTSLWWIFMDNSIENQIVRSISARGFAWAFSSKDFTHIKPAGNTPPVPVPLQLPAARRGFVPYHRPRITSRRCSAASSPRTPTSRKSA